MAAYRSGVWCVSSEEVVSFLKRPEGVTATSASAAFHVRSLSSLSEMRAGVRGFLSDQHVAPPEIANAVIVAHELAANALEHASLRSGEVTVEVEVEAANIYVSVRCEPAAIEPLRPRASTHADERGRGLLIVGAVAEWRESKRGREQVVTARLAR